MSHRYASSFDELARVLFASFCLFARGDVLGADAPRLVLVGVELGDQVVGGGEALDVTHPLFEKGYRLLHR